MLSLKGIIKSYKTGDTVVRALDGVSVEFRKSEFVSILGPSGCGKTTLLNIIGGLDRYENGEMSINGVSTKQYKDKNWDSYRNHRIGFVFQSYNLIPHQTVLSNVELALTLSGVSKAERRARAIEVLNRVGLGDQLNKKPNQMSGGQMQRVAIARALINNPDILLADEPTGALDSETSIQIMEILRSISKDKLIIMVTHNPDLAKEYSSRIIRLLDGKVTDDSNPLTEEEIAEAQAVEPQTAQLKHRARRKKAGGKTSMSGFTALMLSLNNLMTKKARTFLTSFAGSIGIIGIALILAISNGIQVYIDRTEEEAVSSYPIMIENTAMDLSALMGTMISGMNEEFEREPQTVYSNDVTVTMIESAMTGLTTNNLKDFKVYLEDNYSDIEGSVNDVAYNYSTVMNIYKADTSNGVYKVNPSGVMDALGMGEQMGASGSQSGGMQAMMTNTDVWMRLLNNKQVLETQYDVVKGHLPENYNEVVIILDENGDITDYTLYSLGLKDSSELKAMMKTFSETGEVPKTERSSYLYNELLELKFKLLVNTDYFEKVDGRWVDQTDDDIYVADKLNQAIEIKVVGLIKPSEDANVSSAYYGMVGYTDALMTELINRVNQSEIVADQKADETVDVFTGLKFKTDESTTTMDDINAYIATLPAEEAKKAAGYIAGMRQSGATDEKIIEAFQKSMSAGDEATLEGNYALMGVSDFSNPSSIYIYPKDFESKDVISGFIEDYNRRLDENEKITYNDYIGLMLSSITVIINAISYILIAFVGISLVVSSIMIGIITYISVLERTKEIGILRSIGASKRDIARVFNAEALILGFVAGAIGIGVTLLLCLPINALLHNVAGIDANAVLPAGAAVVLVAISMFLTFIAGLIPSRIASKKDPVTALRTE